MKKPEKCEVSVNVRKKTHSKVQSGVLFIKSSDTFVKGSIGKTSKIYSYFVKAKVR